MEGSVGTEVAPQRTVGARGKDGGNDDAQPITAEQVRRAPQINVVIHILTAS